MPRRRRPRNDIRAPIAAGPLNGAPIAAGPLNGDPNEEVFNKALLILWIVGLYIVDIVLTSKRYLQQMPPTMRPQPPSLLDPSSTPEVSWTLSALSLIAILLIMTEAGINWFAQPRRLINYQYHEDLLRAIFLANWILWTVRSVAVQFVNDEILWLAISSVLLGMFLDWAKRMFTE